MTLGFIKVPRDDKFYVGNIESLTEADMKKRLETAFEMGKKLVNEIEKEKNS